jgi:hypothetical protein
MWVPTSFLGIFKKKQYLDGGARSRQQENGQSLLYNSWFIVLVLILLGAILRFSVLFLEIG